MGQIKTLAQTVATLATVGSANHSSNWNGPRSRALTRAINSLKNARQEQGGERGKGGSEVETGSKRDS